MDVHISPELSRAVIRDLAPDELKLFDVMTRAYVADPRRGDVRGSGDEPLGFGVAEAATLMTPVVLAISERVVIALAGELVKPLARSAAERILVWVGKLVRREPDAEPLTSEQLASIEAMVRKVAHGKGLSKLRADALTAAVVACLKGNNAAAS
jgi:hypothetical protein